MPLTRGDRHRHRQAARDCSAMRSWREAEQMSVLRAAVRILMRQPGGGSLVLYSSVAAPCDGIETLDQYT